MAEEGNFVARSSLKWHIALALGLPAVVGVGYWYLIRKGKNCKNFQGDGTNKNREIPVADKTKVSQKQQRRTPLEEATALKEEGNKCFKSGQYDEALSYYEKAIELCPKSETLSLATFYHNKAATHEQLQNYNEVKKACTEALCLNPKYIKALLRRAKACEQKKELSEAFEDLTAACILESFQSQSTLVDADRLLQELGRQHAKEAIKNQVLTMPSDVFIKTYFSTFLNDPIHSFLLKTDGDFSKGFLKAVEHMKKKEYDSIIPACTEEINLTETESLYKNEALVLRGTFYHLIGNNNLALSDFDIVINNEKVDPKLRVNALLKRASISLQTENHSSSFQDYQKAEEIDPLNSDVFHHRGQVNLLLEKLQEASDDFDSAISLSPNNPITIVQKCFTDYRFAFILRDESKLESVMKNFEKIINDYPECTTCYTLYAQVLGSHQKYEKADSLYKKALKVEPENATILVHWAFLKLQWTADVDTAIKLITQALKVDEKCVFAYETLGSIEVQRGNLKKAIELFDKAISLANTETEIAHLYSLKYAASAQKTVSEKMNIKLPSDFAKI